MTHVKHLFFLLTFLLPISANAQTVLLHKEAATEERFRTTPNGQNKGMLAAFYFGGGFAASAGNPGARIIYGGAGELDYSMRVKVKVTNFFSYGFESFFNTAWYKLKQTEGKVLPDTLLNRTERMDFRRYGAGAFTRINFDLKRGDYIGTYLDLGVKVGAQTSRHTVKNNNADGSFSTTKTRHLPYANDITSAVYARLGRGHIELYGYYYLSDFFKAEYGLPQLPRLTVGLNFGFY